MNDTDFKSLIQPSHSRKPSSYDPRDRLRTTHIKMTPITRLYLQALSQLEGKSQGQLIEEWATSRFAWKKYSGAILNVTKRIRGTVRWLLLTELKAKEVTFLELLNDDDYETPKWGRYYYFFRRGIELVQVRLAFAVLSAENRMGSFINRMKSLRIKRPTIPS